MPSSERERRAEQLRDILRRHEEDRSAEGQRIGRYEIHEKIGAGGVGVVYRARDPELGREVAVKILGDLAGLSEEARARFRREAHAAAGLTHPNLVKVFDVGEDGNRGYLVMELVAGASLREILRGKDRDLRSLLRLLEKTARGVGQAHRHGIVHRDLKPANILMGAGEEPKIGDFGLAFLQGRDTALTETGSVVGTPMYMAPEQIEGMRNITPRTDVYALGVILYEMLTRKSPYEADSATSLYQQIMISEPTAPRRLDPAIPAELEAVCLKALDKEPSRRYADAEEMAEELGRYLQGLPVRARRPSPLYRLRKQVRRNRAAWGLGTAVVLAAIAAVVVVATLRTEGQRRSEANRLALRAERTYEAGRYDETKLHAEEALRVWPGHAEARYWLTRLKIRRYQSLRGVPEARVVRGLVEVTPPKPESAEEKSLREEIGKEIATLGDRAVPSGILALWGGDYDEALRQFAGVPEDAAGAWEADFYSAVAHYLKGGFDEAMTRLRRHLGRDPGLTNAVWIRTLIAAAQTREQEGKDSETLYVQAIAACADVEGPMARILEAQALVAWGKMNAYFGRDPEEQYDKAIGLVAGVDELEAHIVRGDALLRRAYYRGGRGRLDPKDPAEFKEAIRAYGRAAYG
ncbi:MAG: protein kinase domain-containing protein, partial [Planctomycetota bacterium]